MSLDYSIVAPDFDVDDNAYVIRDFLGTIVTFNNENMRDFCERYIPAIPEYFPEFSFVDVKTFSMYGRCVRYYCNIKYVTDFKDYVAYIPDANPFSTIYLSFAYSAEDGIALTIHIGLQDKNGDEIPYILFNSNSRREIMIKPFRTDYPDFDFKMKNFLNLYKR